MPSSFVSFENKHTVYAKWPKSKNNDPNPSKMAQIWSKSRSLKKIKQLVFLFSAKPKTIKDP